jgi:uroporphyrinogen-III synthase
MMLPLHDRHIVVTRPAGQASHLAEALRDFGAHPILFPVLTILDIENPKPLLDIALRLDEFQIAIFVSPNAVRKALNAILAHRAWPSLLPAATIGESSEAELRQHGIVNVLAPKGRFDSEALLELPALTDVAGKRIVIFRGDGGRELLGEALTARGAEVSYVACYRRGRPTQDAAVLLKHWEDGKLDALTVTSSEGLRNLYDMVGKLGQAWLRKTPLFVPHARIAEQAESLGLGLVRQTGPGDNGLIAGLIDYFKHHEQQASS